MIIDGEAFLFEYNVRMGDPETQVVLPRIQNDMAALLLATVEKRLHEVEIQINDQAAATVVSVAGGYPEAFEKGHAISGLAGNGLIFQAGTAQIDNKIVTNGGRVLASTGFGNDVQEAEGTKQGFNINPPTNTNILSTKTINITTS